MLRKIFAVVVALGVLQSAAQAVQTATYNPATGNITFSDLAGAIGLTIKAPPGLLIPAAALSAGSNAIDTSIANEITYANFGGYTQPLNGGNILPAGLLVNPGVTFGGQLNFAGDQFVGDVVGFVPEPTSIGLAGMGLIGLAARRRRA